MSAIDDCWNSKGVRGDRSCERLRQHAHCRHCEVYGAAAGEVMQRALPEAYRAEWAAHFALPEEVERDDEAAVMIFRIGQEWLALPASVAVTVTEQTRPRRLPHRNEGILQGVVNVRGQIRPCISLAALLPSGAPSPAAGAAGSRAFPRLLAVQLQQQAYALPVDELLGIHRHAPADLQPVPAAANKELYRYVTAILRVDRMFVGCLDPALLGRKLASVLK
ncbi:MAG TPA: chemotaxis protein CheW [Noviherbaspirillum sp.]|jgi:chemotaxis-related protein WspD|uniref:chemotaxis protein CheW n=1 Tax=Noviherbaspirillum sp. TaxID=1926288 RepID=UPI002F944D7B